MPILSMTAQRLGMNVEPMPKRGYKFPCRCKDLMMDKLTDEQAEAMLQQLSRHFREPVLPVSRYCGALETWSRCIGERTIRLQKELLPNFHDWDNDAKKYTEAAAEQRREFKNADPSLGNPQPLPRDRALAQLHRHEEFARRVEFVFLQIRKSNLLARIIYEGEKLRTKMCPEHKGEWSGIESSGNICPHKCQLTGWIQEEADTGKPLPGVFAVTMTPTGDASGEVTMVRDADGAVLGKAVVQELSPVKPGDKS